MSLLRPRALVLALLAVLLTSPLATVGAAPQLEWASIDGSLSTMAANSNLLVAEFRGSTCQTIHGRNQDTRLAIASTFKLYVLGELARQIQLGQASWDEQITLQDDLMLIEGGTGLKAAQVHSRHDHRIAMACAVAALRADGPVSIEEAEAINKSYPDFYGHIQQLGAEVTTHGIKVHG